MSSDRRQPGSVGSLAALWASAVLVSMPACSEEPSGAATTEAPDAPVDVLPAPDPAPIEIVPVVAPAPKPSGPLAPGTGCTNSQCHAQFESARYVHGAVSPGDCSVCHEEDLGDHRYPLKRAGNDGCRFCHAVDGKRVHQHLANEASGCTGCHDPHASETKFLLRAPSIEVLCSSCHLIDRGAHGHGPFAAGECMACHEPHESRFEMLLRGGEGAQHCFLCHEETRLALEQAPHVHAPAAVDCTTCHAPHATDHPHALAQPIEQACFSCHRDLEEVVTGATAPHAAVFTAERCANCHDPHAAGLPGLLRERQEVLCLECHGEPIVTADGRMIPDMAPEVSERTFLHGPVKVGDCTACHNVHGAGHSRLLREQFTPDFYASFDLSNYTLCFGCHDKELVTEERTETLTNFRDGDVNLHYLHVNRQQRGRTCRACHSIHGSDLPRHVAEEVPFEGSQWAMPIGFEMTDTGGSCAPGCHEVKTYRRVSADPIPSEPRTGEPP